MHGFSCLRLCLRDSSMLCVIVSHLFSLLCRIPMCEYAAIYFFARFAIAGVLSCFHFGPSRVLLLWHSGACLLVNICVHFCWVWSRSKLAGSRGVHMLSFRNAAKRVSKMVAPINTPTRSVCLSNLSLLTLGVSVIFISFHFLLFSFLVRVRWYYILVLIFIVLMTNTAGHVFFFNFILFLNFT